MRNPRRFLSFMGAVVAIAALAVTANFVQARREDVSLPVAPELLSQLPSGASTLIFFDLGAMRGSPFFQGGAALAPLATTDHDYAAFVAATGFDYAKDLDRAAIGVWPPASPSEKYKTVIIAEGRFNEQKIRDYAAHNGKIDHQQGHEVFLFPSQNPAGRVGLVFLSDSRLAMVEGVDLAPLFNTSPTTADDPVRAEAAHIDGAPAFVVSRVPPVPDNFAVGGLQSAQLVDIIRSVQWVTLAARPEGNTLRLSLEGECRNDAEARQLQSLLLVLKTFGQAALSSPQARQKMDPQTYNFLQILFTRADISQSAERVRIRMELTPDTLKSSGSQAPQ